MLKNPHFILDDIYMRFLSETYADVMRAGADAEIVLTHSLLVGAHQAAEKLGRPCARIALAPMHLQSAEAPSLTPPAPYILQPRSRAAVGYNRLVRAIVRRSVNARIGRLHRFRQEVGLPPTQEDFFLDFGRDTKAQAVFGLFSPHFAPIQTDHPRNLCAPGFPFYEPAHAERRRLAASLEAFLAAGTPPIVFTLGSFAPEVSGVFYDESLQAARAIGRRAVILAGPKDAARLAPLVGPDEYVCERAPHSRLFPKSLCIVHHGGIGTTAEAIRAGKPQIVVPFFGDQPDHGMRVERLGLGRAIKLSAYTASRTAAALQAIITREHADRARNFAARTASDVGVAAIADWAEEVA